VRRVDQGFGTPSTLNGRREQTGAQGEVGVGGGRLRDRELHAVVAGSPSESVIRTFVESVKR